MSEHLVICEFAYDCDSVHCSYTQPRHGQTVYKASCGHTQREVDIIEYNEVSTNDPNYQFKRKKHGF